MSPNELALLRQMKERIKIDLDDLKIMTTRKMNEFVQIEIMIQQYDADLSEVEKQVIDCVNIEDENE